VRASVGNAKFKFTPERGREIERSSSSSSASARPCEVLAWRAARRGGRRLKSKRFVFNVRRPVTSLKAIFFCKRRTVLQSRSLFARHNTVSLQPRGRSPTPHMPVTFFPEKRAKRSRTAPARHGFFRNSKQGYPTAGSTLPAPPHPNTPHPRLVRPRVSHPLDEHSLLVHNSLHPCGGAGQCRPHSGRAWPTRNSNGQRR